MKNKNTRAFTLVELMIALFVALVVFGGVFTVFQNQKLLFVRQEAVLKMNKEARAALFLMSSYIKNAGINTPDCSSYECTGIKEITLNRLTLNSDYNLNNIIENSEEITFIKNEKIVYFCEGRNISDHNDGRCDFLIGNVKTFSFSKYCDDPGTCVNDLIKGVNINLELEESVDVLDETVKGPKISSRVLILNRTF